MARSDSREARLVRSARGKWGRQGFPRKGWECVEIEDLGAPEAICEMCEAQEIRYAHHMRHPSYFKVLVVGCVCAGHMEGNPTVAQARDKGMRSRVAKRKRWLSRKWMVSEKGYEWIQADGYRTTVWPREAGWGATVAAIDGPFLRHIRRAYSNSDQAKLAAFDLVTRLLTDGERP